MAIAQTIHGEGLDVFYSRRVAGPKPEIDALSTAIPERLLPYDDPLLLERFTKSMDGGRLETTLKLEKIRCAACVWLCEHHVKRMSSVHDVQINYATQKARVQYDPKEASLGGVFCMLLSRLDMVHGLSSLHLRLRRLKKSGGNYSPA
jgi:Cu2+-exporting ATPase